MKLIKEGSVGQDVCRFCQLLDLPVQDRFSEDLKCKAIDLQKKYNLDADGIVGNATWLAGYIESRLRDTKTTDITDLDYQLASEYLDCTPADIKAIREVETSGKSGFVMPGKPQILFEGHLFWKYLKQEGSDPEKLRNQFPDIVYPKWTKQYYIGGSGEYTRFSKASRISEVAAIKSTSFGMFQILGENWKSCYCSDPFEFYRMMCKSKFSQFVLGIAFLRSTGMYKPLASHNWVEFAERYNGPAQSQNRYSDKLEEAWNKYK